MNNYTGNHQYNGIKGKKVFIGFSVFFIALIILGVVFVRIRGLSNLWPTSIINVSVDLCGMTLGLILFVSCVLDVRKDDDDMRYYLYVLSIADAGLFLNLACWLVEGNPSLRVVSYLANTLYHLCLPAGVCFFWRYLRAFFRATDHITDLITKILDWALILRLILGVLNIPFGWFFTINEAGVYSRSSGYYFLHVYGIVMCVLCCTITFMNLKKLKPIQTASLLLFILTPILDEVIALRSYGLSIGFGVITLDLLMIYCFLNVERGQEKAQAARDLALARSIQKTSLPDVFPPFPEKKEVSLYASLTPALAIGGDFYDFFLIDENHLALVIADASGEGMPASLFMMTAKVLIKNQLRGGANPARALEEVNAQLSERNLSMSFVTAWVAVLELSTGKVTACNAGHTYPGIRRAGGGFVLSKYKHDVMMGVYKKVKYHAHIFELQPGDCLFVFTDGVTQAAGTGSERFGEERLIEVLNSHADAEPEELICKVNGAIDRFTAGAAQFDDITMLCLKYKGDGQESEEIEQ